MSLLDSLLSFDEFEPIVPFVTYQGSKRKFASAIFDIINLKSDERFYDLCCGSGALTIEALNRGVSPGRITMLDSGPWGLVWKLLSGGNLDKDLIYNLVSRILIGDIDKNILRLADEPPSPESFLVLQSVSFGGKAIWIKDGKWKHHNFLKTTSDDETYVSVRTRLLNLADRLFKFGDRFRGVTVETTDIASYRLPDSKLARVYIDPPYDETLGYSDRANFQAFLFPPPNVVVYVSEGRPLSSEAYQLGKRHSGPMSKDAGVEYLSVFRSMNE